MVPQIMMFSAADYIGSAGASGKCESLQQTQHYWSENLRINTTNICFISMCSHYFLLYAHISIHIWLYIYIYMHMFVHIHVNIYLFISTYTCTCRGIHVYIYIIYLHTPLCILYWSAIYLVWISELLHAPTGSSIVLLWLAQPQKGNALCKTQSGRVDVRGSCLIIMENHHVW